MSYGKNGEAFKADGASDDAPLSVSAALNIAKNALEGITIRLLGEVSEVSNKAGYKAVYFTVKDQNASLPCMMWMNRFKPCGVQLSVGQLVELTGRFSLYAPKGRMNFDVFHIELAGEGKLRMQVANLARRLESEGLMDVARKRPLPQYPERIGVVTSPRGAAVHDVLRTLRRRFPVARVLLAGVPVEGKTAAAGIVQGLHTLAASGIDVVLVVRGGGSFEDLMPFNDELLARAIASCPVPVVTGIGHEPDTTIADMVADLRASTPTAAAEAVVPALSDTRASLFMKGSAMTGVLRRRLDSSSQYLKALSTRPLFADSMYVLSSPAQALDSAANRLCRAIPDSLNDDRRMLDSAQVRMRSIGSSLIDAYGSDVALNAARLHDLSPLTVLARGYAVARSEDGEVVKSVKQVSPNDFVSVLLTDGRLNCTVDSVQEQG